MKRIIVFACLFGFSISGISQQAEKEEKSKVKRITVVKSEKQTTTKAPVNSPKRELTPAEELHSCEEHLKAIDQKAAYIKLNPEELKLAKENGWFEDARETKIVLEKRIKELKLQLKK